MLLANFLLLACQLLGQVARDVLGLPAPGAVVGLFLPAVMLACRRRRPYRS